MITFNLVAPFLLQETLQLSVVQYGQLLLLVGVSYFLGATVNSYLVKYVSIHRLIVLGLSLLMVSSVGLLVITVMGDITVMNVILLICIIIFSLGFMYPNCFAYALDISPEKGYASALIGSAILVGVSVISAIVSRYNNINHEFCLSFTLLVLAVFSILSYLLTRLVKAR